MKTSPVRIGLYGCAPGTGNLGVDALRISFIEGLRETGAKIEVSVFDFGSGIRESHTETGVPIRLVGASFSRRLYSTSNLQQMLVAARLKLGRFHPVLSYIQDLDILCDITGGDSFTEIYGKRRFRGSTIFKDLALASNSKLVLLPQTYGPFFRESSIATAQRILRESFQVWARDENSLDIAKRLVGPAEQSAHVRQTIDVAFGLPSRKPRDPALIDSVSGLRQGNATVVGVNVSGLLYNRPGYARSNFGFRVDYNRLVDRLLDRLVSDTSIRTVLIPHVGPGSGYKHDNDAQACQEIAGRFPPDVRHRVLVLPDNLNPIEIKWAIGNLDWLCATRMHAAIAGISQGIATAAIAYSDKTLGVFRTASAGTSVFDPRSGSEDEILESLLEHYSERNEHAETLRSGIRERSRVLGEFFETFVS